MRVWPLTLLSVLLLSACGQSRHEIVVNQSSGASDRLSIVTTLDTDNLLTVIVNDTTVIADKISFDAPKGFALATGNYQNSLVALSCYRPYEMNIDNTRSCELSMNGKKVSAMSFSDW